MCSSPLKSVATSSTRNSARSRPGAGASGGGSGSRAGAGSGRAEGARVVLIASHGTQNRRALSSRPPRLNPPAPFRYTAAGQRLHGGAEGKFMAVLPDTAADAPAGTPAPADRPIWIGAAAVALGGAALYGATLAPGLGGTVDSAEFQHAAYN